MIKLDQINKFKASKLLCVDIETYDPGLLEDGPGTHRGKGFICGVGFATDVEGAPRERAYLSLAHPDTQEDERVANRLIVKELLSGNNAKIGANIVYDCEWLNHEGIATPGKKNDVQYAEPLINEYKRSYNLNNLAKDYGLPEKKSSVLEDYNTVMGWKEAPIANIWRMPKAVAEEYCNTDVDLPLDIFKRQSIILSTQSLWDVYNMETDLIPVILRMRRNGVKLDMALLKATVNQVSGVHFDLKEQIHDFAGKELNINSPKQLAELFDKNNIPYPRHPVTPKNKKKGHTVGNPDISKAVLQRLSNNHPIAKTILEYRHYETLQTMFLHKYATCNQDGRIYCTYHPLRNDERGTVSGRFSASNPNLQQVSAKKEEGFNEDAGFNQLTGQVVRRMFIPETGKRWAKLDYSQIEYRLMAHYATGPGSDELRESYCNDKKMDYHKRIMDQSGFSRRIAKNLNFGGMYGIGQKTAATLFGWTMDEARDFLNEYHRTAPYIKATRERVSSVVGSRKYLHTILGRKARLHSSRKLHSFFNRLMQGSAADIMKKGMVDAEKSGVFDELDVHITVHDELDVSYVDDKHGNKALLELQHIMENTVKLEVPVLVDCHTGANWAEAD